MSLEKTKKIADGIDGFLSEKEGEFLYKTANGCRGEGAIVEIGSWKGKSTVYLARGSKSGNQVKVYAIDPHRDTSAHRELGVIDTLEEFKQNIKRARINEIVEPLVKTSKEATENWKKPIEFLWIDGDHSYEMVKIDFLLWSPYLIKGGIIAFHDAVSGDPKKVVCKFVLKSNNFLNSGLVDSIFYARRADNLSLSDKVRNRIMIILLNLYEFFRGLPLPKSIRQISKKMVNKLTQKNYAT